MLGLPSSWRIFTQVRIVFGSNPQARAIVCASTMKLLVVHRYRCAFSSTCSRTGRVQSSSMLMEPYRRTLLTPLSSSPFTLSWRLPATSSCSYGHGGSATTVLNLSTKLPERWHCSFWGQRAGKARTHSIARPGINTSAQSTVLSRQIAFKVLLVVDRNVAFPSISNGLSPGCPVGLDLTFADGH